MIAAYRFELSCQNQPKRTVRIIVIDPVTRKLPKVYFYRQLHPTLKRLRRRAENVTKTLRNS